MSLYSNCRRRSQSLHGFNWYEEPFTCSGRPKIAVLMQQSSFSEITEAAACSVYPRRTRYSSSSSFFWCLCAVNGSESFSHAAPTTPLSNSIGLPKRSLKVQNLGPFHFLKITSVSLILKFFWAASFCPSVHMWGVIFAGAHNCWALPLLVLEEKAEIREARIWLHCVAFIPSTSPSKQCWNILLRANIFIPQMKLPTLFLPLDKFFQILHNWSNCQKQASDIAPYISLRNFSSTERSKKASKIIRAIDERQRVILQLVVKFGKTFLKFIFFYTTNEILKNWFKFKRYSKGEMLC